MRYALPKPGLRQLLGGLIGAQTLVLIVLALTADEGQPQLITAAAISLIVTLAALWLLKTGLANTIRQASTDIRTFYTGDIDRNSRFEATRWRDFEPLADAYNGLADKLQPVLDMLGDSSGQFSRAADEIATATAQTTERMAQQEQEAASIGNGITSMAAAVTQVAQEAGEAADHVRESDNFAQEGKEVMTNAIGAVMSLSADVTEAAAVIGNLGEKSRDINAVLDMINSVAEQTNLLALNAAIEAARAGEAGRGFAVVADEVRSLAARTQESTANIKSIIQALLASVDQASKVINSGSDKTGECEEMVEQATITFAEIVGSLESLKTANQGITRAAEQQSSAADVIGHSMDTITSVTLGTSEDAQHISQWCDKLVRTADQINSIVCTLTATSAADNDSTQGEAGQV